MIPVAATEVPTGAAAADSTRAPGTCSAVQAVGEDVASQRLTAGPPLAGPPAAKATGAQDSAPLAAGGKASTLQGVPAAATAVCAARPAGSAAAGAC